MNGNSKRCLFGGAILAAGLSAPVALGQQLVHDYSGAFAYAVDYSDFFPIDYEFFIGPGPFAISAGVDGASSTLTASDAYFRVTASSTAPDYLGVGFNLQNDFHPDQDLTALVSWDFTGDNGSDFPSFMLLDDLTNGVNLVNASVLVNPVGSVEVPLSAAALYRSSGLVTGWNAGGESFFQVRVIPAPGAAGVLGLAGVLATGRRRR